jgi:aerobic carbon-monoxide dehydrogenase small subunit
MKQITLTINGCRITASIQPRTHLADFLRERLNLTGTHLRCEQGACGACTLLVDGQPARSCITYAVMCEGASVQTIEGLQDDALMAALRRAFSEEHGLQCGFCTPGMLVTARDIALRLPDATAERVRLELSGNLCRCTGYVNIVRAIMRVLAEQRAGLAAAPVREVGPVGPVGARAGKDSSAPRANPVSMSVPTPNIISQADGTLGLDGRKPNIEIQNAFTVARSADDVWSFFADPAQVVPCLPGARITGVRGDSEFDGLMAVTLGPITAKFSGSARLSRDEGRRAGLIIGSGKDRSGGSRASGEVEYAVLAATPDTTTVKLTIRALLAGPLAQFGRSGIVENLVLKMTERFAANLEARLSGSHLVSDSQSLDLGSLFRSVIVARLRAFFRKLFGRISG